MEQGLVSLNGTLAIHSISATASVPKNDSTIEQQTTDDNISSVTAVPSDDVMDLLRAIEMSRLQSVRENEQNMYRSNTNNNDQNSILSTNDKIEYFNDLQQAIELSLRIKNEKQLTNETTSLFSRIF